MAQAGGLESKAQAMWRLAWVAPRKTPPAPLKLSSRVYLRLEKAVWGLRGWLFEGGAEGAPLSWVGGLEIMEGK